MIITAESLEFNSPYLLLRDYEPETTSYVAQATMEDKPFFGQIVNIRHESQYKLDDIVMFGRNSTTRIGIDGKTHYVIIEDDIIAKVKNTQ